MPDVASIDIQEEIQWFMRPYLLDFLVEAHTFFQLLPETMFLAINLLDRYCSRRVVYKRHYQLVGCAALLIAAKYGDRKERVPLIRELKTMCCMLYDEEMFTQMEWHVLNTLDWMVGHPAVDSFLQLALFASGEDDVELERMSWYICEIALYHRDFVSTKPSVLARASLALSRAILSRREVSDGIWGNEEKVTLVALTNYLHQPSEVLAKKYASPQMSGVSIILEEFMVQQEALASRSLSSPSSPNSFYQQKGFDDRGAIYSTPQKHTANAEVMNGYITPPITPQNDYDAGMVPFPYTGQASRGPVTPTPAGTNLYPQQPSQYQQYQHI